ncbi:MAG: hypothetical protein HY506_02500 [Candidatus Yanofskybacteria bacterium]|nr:hypothetical protein [Candidatus Yanofskybacteria bacterium]
MIKKQTILWLIVLAVGIGLVSFSYFSKDTITPVGDSPSPEASPTPTPPGAQSSESPYPNIINKYPPAECVLSGEIDYLEPSIYQSRDSVITYKNVDSKARHIVWTVSPKDDLSVGPNLFARLPIPDGSESISVVLPAEPLAKDYTLTAQITYGVFIKGNLEIKTANCSGKIPVNIKF